MRVEAEGGVMVLRPVGALIKAIVEVKLGRELEYVFQEGKTKVVLNLSFCRLMDSHAVGCIAEWQTRLLRSGGMIKLCCIRNNDVRRVLELSILPAFDYYETEAEAVQSFQEN